jgi:hypothetical protein
VRFIQGDEEGEARGEEQLNFKYPRLASMSQREGIDVNVEVELKRIESWLLASRGEKWRGKAERAFS